MCEKLLTVVVPAYNAESYLRKCLGSFLQEEALPYLDIIIADDGSSDQTAAIAEEFSQKYPSSIRWFHKENGGHGSAINQAFPLSKGKYFKVVDADDWVITENLPRILKALKASRADVFLAPFHTVHMLSGERRPYPIEGPEAGRTYTFKELSEWYPAAAAWFSFHGVFYRRDFYEKQGVRLSEGIFYEDTEYSVLPAAKAESIEIADCFFYEYMIGNVKQSVSAQSFVKREDHLRIVLDRLLSFYEKYRSEKLAEEALEFVRIRIILFMGTYEKVLLLYHTDRRYGRKKAKAIRDRLAVTDARLEKRSRRRYYLLKSMNMFRFSPQLVESLYNKLK